MLATIDSTGCSAQLTETEAITINPLPAANLVLGGTGPVCSGTATNITVASSVSENKPPVKNRNQHVGTAVAGAGVDINLPTGTLTAATQTRIPIMCWPR